MSSHGTASSAPPGAAEIRGRERFVRPWLLCWELDVSDKPKLPLLSVMGGLKPLILRHVTRRRSAASTTVSSPGRSLQVRVLVLEAPAPANQVGEKLCVLSHHRSA